MEKDPTKMTGLFKRLLAGLVVGVAAAVLAACSSHGTSSAWRTRRRPSCVLTWPPPVHRLPARVPPKASPARPRPTVAPPGPIVRRPVPPAVPRRRRCRPGRPPLTPPPPTPPPRTRHRARRTAGAPRRSMGRSCRVRPVHQPTGPNHQPAKRRRRRCSTRTRRVPTSDVSQDREERKSNDPSS